MRTMEIPCIPGQVQITDLAYFYRTRFKHKPKAHAAIAIALLGYMGWPNDPAGCESAKNSLGAWLDGEEPKEFLDEIPGIHRTWGRVADIVQLHSGMSAGRHQQRRGGASVGKAIFPGSKLIKARGASQANMWDAWSAYKDVAHLIAAVMAVCADMQRRNRKQPFGVGIQDMLPIRVVCLVPELVIGVGLHYQQYGLNCAARDGTDPMFDPETLWRIPADIGVEPMLPLVRGILPEEIVILNERRAVNRGRANIPETTPVS